MKKLNKLEELTVLVGGTRKLARLLGIPEGTAYAWIQEGRISRRGYALALKSAIIPNEWVLPLREDLSGVDFDYAKHKDELRAMRKYETKIKKGEVQNIPIVILMREDLSEVDFDYAKHRDELRAMRKYEPKGATKIG